MRILATFAVVLALGCGGLHSSAAQEADACKQCRDQYQRCVKNYAGKTCKTEVDICLKGCRKK
jgi:hypothetical protein